MFLKTHLDEFNKIIMDLKNIVVRVDDWDQVIIVLSYLPLACEHFITTLLYGNDTISMKDVNISLHFKEYCIDHECF